MDLLNNCPLFVFFLVFATPINKSRKLVQN